MPVEPILALIVIAVVANLVVMAALGRAARDALGGRPSGRIGARSSPPSDRHGPGLGEAAWPPSLARCRARRTRRETYDRVVRIVSWVFLLATTTIVAVSGLWSPTQPAILVAARPGRPVRARHPRPAARRRARGGQVRASRARVAITVRDAARRADRRRRQPVLLRLPADRRRGGARRLAAGDDRLTARRERSATSLAVVLGSRPDRPRRAAVAAIVGINLTAMILLAYVAMVIAREQRRARDAAIRLSTIDPLTGLFNRSFFFAAHRARDRPQRPIGPRVLPADDGSRRAQGASTTGSGTSTATGSCAPSARSSARASDASTRPRATAATSSSCSCPETDPTGAFVLAEKIRLGVRAMPLDLPGDRRRDRRCRSAWSAIPTTGARPTS